MANLPGRVPRWAGNAGRLMTAASADEIPVIFQGGNHAVGFDFQGYGAHPFPAPYFLRGSWGRPGRILRPPKGVMWIDAGTDYFQVSAADQAVLEAHSAVGEEVGAALDGGRVSFCQGAAIVDVPPEAFGNASFPDGWPMTEGGSYSFTPLAPFESHRPTWLWSVTAGWPGDPGDIAGGDLLVFVVAFQAADFDSTLDDDGFSGKTSYHDGVYYYESAFEVNVTQPTERFAAHYGRFASLVGRLDRFRCVVVRNTDAARLFEVGVDAVAEARAEAHVHQHFVDAIAGAAGYAALGPSLASLGVELLEVTGVPAASTYLDIVADHFGL